MGWSYLGHERPKGVSVREYLLQMMGADRERVIACSVVGNKVAYMAFRARDSAGEMTRVVALVFLVEERDHDFGWKCIDETMGPVETECPEKILKLLTPLEENEGYAEEWRRKCWERIEKRKARPTFRVGDVVTFEEDIEFVGGGKAQCPPRKSPQPRP